MFHTTKLRRLLAVPAALVAVLAFAPSAHASVNYVDVVGNPAGTYNWSAVNKGTITASLGGLNATCTSASPTGTVIDGPIAKVKTKILTVNNFGLVGCTGIFNTAVNITSVCPAYVETRTTGSTSTTAITDNVLTQVNLGANCLRVQTKPPFASCSLNIGGKVNSVFKETLKADDTQELSISGNTLTANNVAAGCLGIVNNGDAVTFTLNLNIKVLAPAIITPRPNGLINLTP